MRADLARLVGQVVAARRRIYDCPTVGGFVPRGSRGTVEDFDACAGLLIVDFGGPEDVEGRWILLAEPGEVVVVSSRCGRS